ncbi:hypothetical protein [uncultured Duncaniella sp.]|uniref:hypothetical protein n=1 Tax=uncultured Duncaniella sp. TaxID=2768039 RepID=UPI00262E1443|nr:hypothetical protein [uncultured Duncaniella sp.]
METIQCSKCGCVMSALSEACPMCGTATQSRVEAHSQPSDYIKRSDVKLLDGLKETLDSMLYNKQSNPSSNLMVVTSDINGIGGKECGIAWSINVSSTYTNKPTITLYFWDDSAENKARIKKLENASIFSQFDYDCGVDTEKATYLFSEYVRLVWGFNGEVEFDEMEVEKANFYEVEFYLDKEATDKMKRLIEMVRNYNAIAKENNYPLAAIDTTQSIFKGSFPSNKKIGGFLSKEAKVHKKLNAAFEDIIDHCESFLDN